MPPLRSFVCALSFALAIPAAAAAAPTPATQAAPGPQPFEEKRIALPLVGAGFAYVPRATTPHVVIVVSGERGWNKTEIALARHLAPQAVVIGVPYPALARHARRESGCWYVAADFELISHAAQKTLNLPQYHQPILIGYGPGGAIVYSAVAGGPATTFAGLITFDFCPRVDIRREICAGEDWVPEYDDKHRRSELPPGRTLPRDWWALQGHDRRSCPIDVIRRFASAIPKAHVADPSQFDRAIQELWTEKDVKPAAAQPRSATTRELEDELQRLQLPLEFRWPGPGQLTSLLVFFSGDGGWASLDEDVAEHLITRGIGVIGVSSLRYFWKAKPPAQVAADLERLVSIAARSGRPVFTGGFSFGAEVVPVALREWPPSDRRSIAGVVMVAPGPSASFEIDPLDWFRNPAENAATRVAPAVQSLAVPSLCIAGTSEDETPCASLASTPGAHVVRLPGSHHFNNDYASVADAVAQFIRQMAERRP